MTVDFRLLGDVAARIDGQTLDIGHARQRCVLVALLVDVNHRISLEQLVDRVWSNNPPFSARSSLTSYVSRLRRLLADVPGAAISREPSGYVLAADPAWVDLHRFKSAVAKARATAEPIEAAALFDRALELWQGEPFPTLDTPWFVEVRNALKAELLLTQLDRNDVALRAGRHGELLVELTAAHAAHPLDERLAGQLMLAQYRCGQQADALHTYRHTRRRLVEDLGIDPGSALQRVHQQILAGEIEEALAPPPPARRAAAARQLAGGGPGSGLLRRVTTFVGHEEAAARTVHAMREGPLVTLAGVGGVGKTRLAWEVALCEQERFSGGAWICELGPLDNGDAVGHTIAAALRLQHQHGLGIEDSVIEYLRSREVLLVLDNCEHVLEAAATLVGRIVQHCPSVSVLATSRQPLGIEGERLVVVPPLSVDDAVELFVDRAKASRPDFSLDRQSTGAVAEICQRVDCLPLGVELAAARMRVMSAADVIRRLDHMHVVRGGMRGTLPRQQSLAAAIDWSYRLLTESEQELFARLSVFAGSFDIDAAHCVCGADGAVEDDTLDLLVGLVDKSIVYVHSVNDRTRYGLLTTLRAYGRDRSRERGTDGRDGMRHAVYFTELAERAGAEIHGAQERDWVERMLPDYDNLRAAFECAMAAGDVNMALRLVASASELVALRIGYEVVGWAERALAVADAEHPLYAAVVGCAARGRWVRGDFAGARRLATLAEGRVPPRGTARFAYPADVQADVALFGGDAQTVFEYWDREAARACQDGDPVRLVHTVCILSTCRVMLGHCDSALPAARDAVEVADQTANPTTQSTAYFALAFVLKKSQPRRALRLFTEAARLAGEVQNFWWYGIALMEAAATRAVHDEPTAAAGLFVEVLEHWDRVGEWSQQWLSLRYVTRLLVRLGADEDAAFLHHALRNAGKPSPLDPAQSGALRDRLGADRFDAYGASPADGPDAVARARSTLQRHAARAVPQAL